LLHFLKSAIGWGPFFIMLAAISVVVLIFICCLLPETKGRSLEDMSLYFAEITADDSLLEAERKLISDRERAGGVEMISTPQDTPTPTGEAA
jgi:Sugar (and other) transporter